MNAIDSNVNFCITLDMKPINRNSELSSELLKLSTWNPLTATAIKLRAIETLDSLDMNAIDSNVNFWHYSRHSRHETH